MKLQRFLVTVPDHNGHNTIFRLENNQLTRFQLKKTFDLALPDEKNFFLGFLPNEIKLLIIRKLISIYLKEALYECAMPLISVCKYTLVQTYLMYFPKPICEISPVSYNFRLSRTLHFCQALVDAVVGCKKSFSDYYIVETRHGYFTGKCYPWYLDTELSVTEMDLLCIENVQEHRLFSIGPEIHQYAWIQGVERDGIYHCRYFRAPIIVLAIISYNHLHIIQKNDLDETFYAITFFMKKVFGHCTGVYLYQPDESEFHLDSVVEL